jgi:hypothetical protein
MTAPKHHTDSISRTCEYVTDWNFEGLGVAAFCGKPSTYSYPSSGGHMAMCDNHAKPHLPNFAWPIQRKGEAR